jgi:hypothetical protein
MDKDKDKDKDKDISKEQDACQKKKYFDFVLLTDLEHQRLINDYGIEHISKKIEELDLYLSNNLKKRKEYRDHNKVIRSWLTRRGINKTSDVKKEKEKIFESNNPKWLDVMVWFNSDLLNVEKINNMMDNRVINNTERLYLLDLYKQKQEGINVRTNTT